MTFSGLHNKNPLFQFALIGKIREYLILKAKSKRRQEEKSRSHSKTPKNIFRDFNMIDQSRIDDLYVNHSRHWKDFRYVYPVLSRRSKGISLGIDLSPGCECTFNCVYCQVEKHNIPVDSSKRAIDLDMLQEELHLLFVGSMRGLIYNHSPFDATPEHLRRLNDVAFSGNGEPTLSPAFLPAVKIAAQVRQECNGEAVKLILITNSTCLHRPEVIEGLEILSQNNGEIWCKLDAGTERFYKKIDRSAVPFDKCIDNIITTGQKFPIIIQTLFSDCHTDDGPSSAEVDAYIGQLSKIMDANALISGVQIHTVRRIPAEKGIEPLLRQRLEEIAQQVTSQTGLKTAVFV